VIHKKNILLTAFYGSSSELLIKGAELYKTLILPNDKVKDSKKLIDVISKEKFDYIISFGQRPNIKNKVHIETCARDKLFHISTNFDFDNLGLLFKQNNIISKISHNAGTSFCNELYLNGLKYISQNNMNTKMVFLHIPFSKNIDDINNFREQIFNVIASIVEERK
jgi:pyroglutamyl-peptidase